MRRQRDCRGGKISSGARKPVAGSGGGGLRGAGGQRRRRRGSPPQTPLPRARSKYQRPCSTTSTPKGPGRTRATGQRLLLLGKKMETHTY